MPVAVDFRPLPFTEAIAAFARRGASLRDTDRWTEMMRDEHAAHFTVARSLGYDINGDIHAALQRLLREGGTFQSFAKEITPTLKSKGWWGKTEGVQLGSRHRLKLIFDTNLRVSYAAGRWEKIQATKRSLPFLMYSALDDERTRPAHRLWGGIDTGKPVILPVDHPWWRTHFPPCGWGCRCSVMQLTESMARRRGGVTEVIPDGPPRRWTNRSTGEVVEVPWGIDPGWDYNPGLAAEVLRTAEQAAKQMADKLVATPPRVAAVPVPQATVKDLADEFEQWFDAREFGRLGGEVRVAGSLSAVVLDFLFTRSIMPESGAITVRERALSHILRTFKGDLRPPLQVLRRLPEQLARPSAVLWDNQTGNLVYVLEAGDSQGTRMIVQLDRIERSRDEAGARVRVRTNSVVSAQLVDVSSLRDRTRYALIEGEV